MTDPTKKSSKTGNKAFGRDEMTALLGGGLSEVFVRQPSAGVGITGTSAMSGGGSGSGSGRRPPQQHKDIADMTTAETAAYLLKQQQQKNMNTVVPIGGSIVPTGTRRHRTNQIRNYHQLLIEEQQKTLLQHPKQQQPNEDIGWVVDRRPDAGIGLSAGLPAVEFVGDWKGRREEEEDSNGGDNGEEQIALDASKRPVMTSQKRVKAAPVILTRRTTTQRRRTSDSGSSRSRSDRSLQSSNLPRGGRIRRHSSCSSSSDRDSAKSDRVRHSGRDCERARSRSSSSSSESRHRSRRRSNRSSSSSSSGSDSEADRRRARLLAKQRQQFELKDDEPTAASHFRMDVDANPHKALVDVQTDGQNQQSGLGVACHKEEISKAQTSCVPVMSGAKRTTHDSSGSDALSNKSNSTEDESSSDASSDSSSTSSSSSSPAVPRPVFVPKHKRGIVPSAEKLEVDELAKQAREQQRQEQRQRESRAMVQQVVMTTANRQSDSISGVDGDAGLLDGIMGAQNAIPDDHDDDIDTDQARDAWEVRELERLLQDLDSEQLRLEEVRDRERRRNMSDKDRLEEDMQTGLYQRPGQRNSQDVNDEGSGKHMQRYFHRGAFYMDESEWDASDVRRKADTYAKAATSKERRDLLALPKVMQVKNFGFANQSKYKGLKAEDTTDKQLHILPLSNSKRHGSKKS